MMGCGVWAMHFVGMLAFQLCTQVDYNASLTVASAVPGIAACGVAATLLARPRLSNRQLCSGGVLIAAGIGSMHYTGMAAMVMSAQLKYDPVLFALSIVLSVLLAMLALWVRFRLQQFYLLSVPQLNIISGAVLGLAVAAMHYIGMAAARFVAPADFNPVTEVSLSDTLVLVITFVVLALGTLAFTVGGMLRYKSIAIEAQSTVAHYQQILQHAPVALLQVNAHGLITSANPAAEQLLRRQPAALAGRSVTDFIPAQIVQTFSSASRPLLLTPRDLQQNAGTKQPTEHAGFDLQAELTVVPLADVDGDLFAIYLLDLKHSIQQQDTIASLKQQLSRTDESAELFLDQIGRDIDQPLEDILQLCNRLLALQLGDAAVAKVTALQDHAVEIEEIHRNAMDLVKFNSGKEVAVYSTFSVRQLLDDIQATAGRHQVKCRLETDDVEMLADLELRADYDILRRVLLNLLRYIQRQQRYSDNIHVRVVTQNKMLQLSLYSGDTSVSSSRSAGTIPADACPGLALCSQMLRHIGGELLVMKYGSARVVTEGVMLVVQFPI